MGPDIGQEPGNEARLVCIAVLICFLSSDLTALICFLSSDLTVLICFLSSDLTVLICFLSSDLTDQSSFERAKFWVNELKQTEEVGTAAL